MASSLSGSGLTGKEIGVLCQITKTQNKEGAQMFPQRTGSLGRQGQLSLNLVLNSMKGNNNNNNDDDEEY